MKALFETIQKLNLDTENLVITVLDGKHAGEKAVYSAGKCVWESRQNGYFKEADILETELSEFGIHERNGIRLFCEYAGRQKQLVICGGGHVSIPVIQIGVMMGWHVTVLEDRPLYADNARRAGASEVLCMPFAEGLARIEGSEDTYFVILTRGHRHDKECLEVIVSKPHAYIGMIGSRRRSAMVKQSLTDAGYDRDVLERVASPIGLNIGAQTPEEIGVAIIAEVIRVKNRQQKPNGYPTELVEAVLSEKHAAMGKVLVTIIQRYGSAPREAGAKMLVLEDGSIIGTIGGGCAEARIYREALLMMKHPDEKIRFAEVDMTATEAEEEGMVCGGRITVLLEVV